MDWQEVKTTCENALRQAMISLEVNEIILELANAHIKTKQKKK